MCVIASEGLSSLFACSVQIEYFLSMYKKLYNVVFIDFICDLSHIVSIPTMVYSPYSCQHFHKCCSHLLLCSFIFMNSLKKLLSLSQRYFYFASWTWSYFYFACLCMHGRVRNPLTSFFIVSSRIECVSSDVL